jgi:hypothetical protein
MSGGTPNAQYNLAKPDSLAIRAATKVRHEIFRMVSTEFDFRSADMVLDIGVTSDQSYASSNYFEMLYPYKDRIVAAGIDDARFLEELYPGLRFVYADALDLPFEDGAFDYVHSSAVLEHVGSLENQCRMIAECVRVARKGICLATPNRWFPIEFHTQLPLLHWLPKGWFRRILAGMGQTELAKEENLNLMTERDLRKAVEGVSDWSFRFDEARLLGLRSNLVLFGRRDA